MRHYVIDALNVKLPAYLHIALEKCIIDLKKWNAKGNGIDFDIFFSLAFFVRTLLGGESEWWYQKIESSKKNKLFCFSRICTPEMILLVILIFLWWRSWTDIYTRELSLSLSEYIPEYDHTICRYTYTYDFLVELPREILLFQKKNLEIVSGAFLSLFCSHSVITTFLFS